MPNLTAGQLLRAAGAVGLVHAAFSLFWAWGGTWLVDTVGRWALEWRAESPATVALVLTAVAAVKAVAAVVPVLEHEGRLPWSRGWRVLSWGGATVLLVYGTANAVGAWLVLTGIVDGGPTDRAALLGHALLWDPLFALWGALLASGLWRSRRQPGRPVAQLPSRGATR